MSLYGPQYKNEQGNIVDLPINAKKLDGYTYNEYSKYYTTSSTTENAFLVTIPYVKALSDGLVIHCQFHAATKSGATLNVNSLGAKGIYYRYATAITTHIVANNYVDLIYSASIDKWVLLFSYDANSNTLGYQVRTNNGSYYNGASTSCYRYQMLVETTGGLEAFTSTSNSTGISKTQLSPKYIPNGAIRYYSGTSTIASKGKFSATALWQQYQGINLKYSFNISTITTDAPCYIKMSRNNDGTLSPVYSATSGGHPLVFALPTTKDGYYYTYLGRTYTSSSTVYLELEICHPTFYYDGGIRVYDGTYLYDWAKASTKPTYTASEVGALPSDTTYVKSASKSGNTLTITPSSGTALTYTPSFTDNNQTIKVGTTTFGANATVELTAGSNVTLTSNATNNKIEIKSSYTDTGATSIDTTGDGDAVSSASYDASTRKITLTKDVTIPTKTSDLTNDSGFITSHQSIKTLKTDNTSAQSTSSNEAISGSGTINLHKISKTGTYSDLIGTPTIPTKDSWNYDDRYVKYTATQSLTDTQKTQARTNIGAGTSNFTGYTSTNKLSTEYINNKAGWTSVSETTVSNWGFTKNVGTVTKVNNTTPDSNGNVTITIPTVNNGTLTIKGGTTNVTTFTANQSGNSTLSITAGSNVSLDTGTANTIKISATDTKYSAGTGLTLTDTTFSVSKANVSTMLNLLDTGSSTPVDADYYISQYVGGGTTTTSYHRRPMSALWNYIKSKGDNTYLGKDAKAANSDKLDGNDSTYFQKALPQTGYAGKVLKSTTVPGTVTWEDDTNTNQTIKVGSTTFGANDVVGLVAGTNIDSITADTSAKTITINAKDTTYSSKTASSGGTDVSLVTTGEKYTWNNKMSSLTIATPTTDTEYELLGFTDSSGNTNTINSIGTGITAKNGNLTFGGNVTISGDLEINGESSRLIFGPTDVMQLIYGKVDKVYNSGSSATKPIWLGSGGHIAVCDTYAGGTAVTLNGTSKAASTASFYAPTSIGTNGKLLASNGSSLTWTNDNRSLLHHDLGVTIENTTTNKGWKMFNSSYNGFLLKSVRFNAQSPSWGVGDFGAGIVFGGGDTKGVVSVSYGNPQIKIAGGNGSRPVWWVGLTGTSGITYDLDKFRLNPKTAEVSNSGSISTGAKNNASITLVITDPKHPLTKGVWKYSGTYGVFLIFANTAITTMGSPRTEYICGYVSTSIPNNASFTLTEV